MSLEQVSAPGKIILCGEYAVLRGAPAVVMAVDRRAVVSVTPHDESWCTVRTPGYVQGRWRFEYTDDGGISWLDALPPSGMPLIETVLALSAPGPATPAAISIDTTAFYDRASGTKLGLGSSAAATVALTAALCGGQVAKATIWKRARKAHESMQGGSGADVAASCFGGLLSYRQDEVSPPASIDWPQPILCKVYFSGVSASTRKAIEKSAEASGSAAWGKLVAVAAATAAAWQDGEVENILAAMRDYTDQLRGFDDATGAGIFSAGHDDLYRAGKAAGVVYKPCGAGGGDCGIALATDVTRLDEFTRVVAALGFVPLDVQRDNRGL